MGRRERDTGRMREWEEEEFDWETEIFLEDTEGETVGEERLGERVRVQFNWKSSKHESANHLASNWVCPVSYSHYVFSYVRSLTSLHLS